MKSIVELLLESKEPSVRYKIRTDVLGEDAGSPVVKALREEIRVSARVTALLEERTADGIIPHGVYRKWNGAHWVLAALADLGYPAGDASLAPLVDQVCACWLSTKHIESVRRITGRARRCASQEGNALYSMLKLGFDDERADQLAGNLLNWQWPDGGWNCDKTPSASTSSFHETWIPLRALALYGRTRGSDEALKASARAAEIFLTRHLFRQRNDGTVMNPRFLQLYYPAYYHYGILNALRVMADTEFIRDARCEEALDVLESKRLRDGGFPSEIQYYATSRSSKSRYSSVKWGDRRIGQTNEWVTAEALSVLHAAGRL